MGLLCPVRFGGFFVMTGYKWKDEYETQEFFRCVEEKEAAGILIAFFRAAGYACDDSSAGGAELCSCCGSAGTNRGFSESENGRSSGRADESPE